MPARPTLCTTARWNTTCSDPLLQEACEVWNLSACVQQESNPRIKAIWERILDHELCYMQAVMELFETHEGRAPAATVTADASSELVSATYCSTPGTELARAGTALAR